MPGVEITSHQARQVRFTGRGPGYDQAEVDDFCAKVGGTLERYEREVVDLRARVLVLEAAAAARAAGEQAAGAKADPSSDLVGGDDVGLRDAAASAEAARLLAAAVTEGEVLVAAARRRAAEVSAVLESDIAAANKRLARLRTAVRDIEARFRGLVGSTLDELSLIGDLVALETTSLTEAVLLGSASNHDHDPHDEPDEPIMRPGFYEKRLAGLRSRIRDSNA